ncbi:SDR family oxidoreductase [Mucilaginibacter sabulilitoris]|uniref:SDR family oxidoreductase n=1 Tax=Mucilaginibacter sabulilitoris TaxID=1173583 RepID=A0ABZ0TH81_9SPHI|nr:SDR family oxidoreductase [Mucilaginibacter sabulilitoris]WPU91593.1 SDR family oxidoreductase [Mucilaginibacter sabulilitoris]
MKKQTIIVTGASSSIGKEIARCCLENGDNVVINALNAEILTEIFFELGGSENLAMVAGNVSNRVTGIKLLAVAIATFGSADVLINNVGISETRSFFDLDEAYLERFLNTNLKGAVLTTQTIIPQMIKQGGGMVINIGTPLGNDTFSNAFPTVQIATKGTIHFLTLQLAAEFGKYNIRFNTIMPGSVRTLKYKNAVDRNLESRLWNRVGEVEEIAEMVYMVIKSSFITGAIITT